MCEVQKSPQGWGFFFIFTCFIRVWLGFGHTHKGTIPCPIKLTHTLHGTHKKTRDHVCRGSPNLPLSPLTHLSSKWSSPPIKETYLSSIMLRERFVCEVQKGLQESTIHGWGFYFYFLFFISTYLIWIWSRPQRHNSLARQREFWQLWNILK